MEKIGVGIVGLGTISKMHIEAISQCTNLELTALCHHSEKRLEEIGKLYDGVNTYLDYDDMLEDDNVKCIVISTPNFMHMAMTIKAIEKNKHVFCEKPPAMTYTETVKIKELAINSDSVVMYGFMLRFSDKYNLIKKYKHRGMFGEFYYGKAGIIRRCGSPRGWFVDSKKSGGGPLIDLGAHIIDLVTYLMDDVEPESVYARAFKRTVNLDNIQNIGGYKALNSQIEVNDVEEQAVVIVNYANGATFVFETSYMSHIKEDKLYLEMQGTKGGVSSEPEVMIYTSQHESLMDIKPYIEDYDFDHQGLINEEFKHFNDCIKNQSSCIASVEHGCRAMKIISAAYKSIELNRVIFMKDM